MDIFFVTGSHIGSVRNYSGRYIRYIIEVTEDNGNSADNILAVRLYDGNNTLKSEGQFWTSGSIC